MHHLLGFNLCLKIGLCVFFCLLLGTILLVLLIFFLHFPAPEILEWKPITLAADIWSLGVCTYVLLTGFSPFGGDTDEETYINIHQAALDFPPELFEGVSDMAKEFISECLVKDPK